MSVLRRFRHPSFPMCTFVWCIDLESYRSMMSLLHWQSILIVQLSSYALKNNVCWLIEYSRLSEAIFLLCQDFMGHSSLKRFLNLWRYFHFGWKVKNCDFVHFYEIWTKVKMPSEINPPLIREQIKTYIFYRNEDL